MDADVVITASQSPVPLRPPAKKTLSRVVNPSEEQEEISKMANEGVTETLR